MTKSLDEILKNRQRESSKNEIVVSNKLPEPKIIPKPEIVIPSLKLLSQSLKSQISPRLLKNRKILSQLKILIPHLDGKIHNSIFQLQYIFMFALACLNA